MPDKYISKVIYGGDVLIDLTSDTVSADSMLSGTTAHGANGVPITGTISSKTLKLILLAHLIRLFLLVNILVEIRLLKVIVIY